MTTQLELFLQGGLGNQLIQLAYADCLQVRTGSRVRINPVLLHPIWSRLRSVSRRQRCWPWASTLPEVPGLPRQVLGLFRLHHSRLRGVPLTDRYSDAELLQQIAASRADAWHGLLGYFQRHEAFGVLAERFWRQLAQNLLRNYSLTPFPRGQVVAHIRLGDYLWPENQRLFARYPIIQQIRNAQHWSRQLGGAEKIHLVTDDVPALKQQLRDFEKEKFYIHCGLRPEDDFAFLCRHRHIVGSNSTFSLCSGRLSSELWGEDITLMVPHAWFVDEILDRDFANELAECQFASKINAILSG